MRGAREHDGGGWSADLVVDDREAVALAGQAQHGEQKVVAVRAVDPTGAKDEIFAADVFDGLFAGQLACAVDVQRVGRVGLDPRLRLAAVEDIIRGVVNEQRVALARLFGENARRLRVDGVGELAFGFGAIDGGVGGGVENEIGRGTANQSAGLIGIGQIDGLAIDGNDGTDAGKDAFQLAAELAGVADDENAGISRGFAAGVDVSLMRASSGSVRKCTVRILLPVARDRRGDGSAGSRRSAIARTI